MRISHNYHQVRPDSKLKHRWSILMFKAAVAYRLGQISTYTNFYNTAISEYQKWEASAQRECEQKSHKNWLGYGETYIVVPSNPIDDFNRFLSIFSNSSHQEIMKTYIELEQNNWMDLYTPI